MMIKGNFKIVWLGVAVMFVLLMFSSAFANQQDKIEGVWYNDVKTAKIQIYKGADQKFYGKIVWLKDPMENGKARTDQENSNEQLRSRPLLGLQLLAGFVKDGNDKYVNGTIYDPKNGKTYSCKITYKGNTLDIRGYIGISLLGRTTTWQRVS